MGSETYKLSGTDISDELDRIDLQQTRDVLGAIGRRRDFILEGVLREDQGDWSVETLLVQVSCDEVPHHNKTGIRFREALAIRISNAPGHRYPGVLALRVGFPRVLHQHQTAEGSPAALCLYFEAPVAVMRTWTAENFLDRIVWWLSSSAKGTLHPADQAVEDLFFASKYEFVLPWDLAARKVRGDTFLVTGSDTRPDGGQTFFLRSLADGINSDRHSYLLDLDLPAVEHGAVEYDPPTLGHLSKILAVRGLDLRDLLARRLLADDSLRANRQQKYVGTILLLKTPIRRANEELPARVSTRAFLMAVDPRKLSVELSAFNEFEGVFFEFVAIDDASLSEEWRSRAIFSMEMLSQNTAERARAQAGFQSVGPNGVVIGAGSLGSALLDFWGRSGWGRWTVVDKDHIKPHNVARHRAFVEQIGTPKAFAVCELQNAATAGANDFEALVVDAYELEDGELAKRLTDADVVIDISTTLDYPRRAGLDKRLARHISCFVTPRGNGCVALVEDKARSIPLHSLEAQYYRAILRSDWGVDHIAKGATFWSGASCRDISYVIPYGRVALHAALLSEQLPKRLEADNSAISVWQYDPASGDLRRHEVDVSPMRSMKVGARQVVFDERLVDTLYELREAHLPSETGGLLLGYMDFNIDAIVIVDALPEPPDSVGTQGSFIRGTDGMQAQVAEASRRTGQVVHYIGEWHSHPPGHLSSPSDDDLVQVFYLAFAMANDGLPAIQLIVGEEGLGITTLKVPT